MVYATSVPVFESQSRGLQCRLPRQESRCELASFLRAAIAIGSRGDESRQRAFFFPTIPPLVQQHT